MAKEDIKKIEQKTPMTDLGKLQLNYFEASSANAGSANQAITHLQTGLLTIILAELAFIGTTGLGTSKPPVLSIIAAALLILAAFSFILGAHSQWRHVIRSSRIYFKLSKDVSEFMNTTGMDVIEKLPEFLQDKNLGLKTNKSANLFFIGSILGTAAASILIFIRLFGMLAK